MVKTTGWVLRGERLVDHASFGHWRPPTFIGALRHDRLNTLWVVNERSTAWRQWTAALITITNRLNQQRKNSTRPRAAKSTGDGEGAKRGGRGAKGPS